MDRQIVYPGSIPLDTDLLSVQRDTLVAVGYLAQATLGTATVADGLACVPTQPASMGVSIGPGSITQFGVVDATPFGSLPAMTTSPLVRMGINLGGLGFAMAAPGSPGQAIDYLVQASLLEADGASIVLPYYNAANPAQPYSGPNNSGAPQVTQRTQSVQIQVKAGPPSAAGTQSLPPVDAGWVGLYVVTVSSGQTSISAANISKIATAPFVQFKLPQLSPGARNLAVFQPITQGPWTAPAGVASVKLRLWGGGGAGGNGFGGAGGGGAGGGYGEGFFGVSPGQSYFVSVGNGGAGAGSGGGTSSFASLASATGGQAGANGASGAGGSGAAAGGNGFGAALAVVGGAGGDPFGASGNWISGTGGSAAGHGGGLGVAGAQTGSVAGRTAAQPGGGGSGGVGSGLGGTGGPGLVLVEW